MPAYDALYSWGTRVRIRELEVLSDFQRTWKYHHPLSDEQRAYAGHDAWLSEVSYYHGVDVLDRLGNIPGYWHEQCLSEPESKPLLAG